MLRRGPGGNWADQSSGCAKVGGPFFWISMIHWRAEGNTTTRPTPVGWFGSTPRLNGLGCKKVSGDEVMRRCPNTRMVGGGVCLSPSSDFSVMGKRGEGTPLPPTHVLIILIIPYAPPHHPGQGGGGTKAREPNQKCVGPHGQPGLSDGQLPPNPIIFYQIGPTTKHL